LADVVLDSHYFGNIGIIVDAVHPSSGGDYSAVSQAWRFTTGAAKYYLKSCKIKVVVPNLYPTGTVRAALYASTGTFGSSAKPTGSPLATSATINISTLPNLSCDAAKAFPKIFTFSSPYAEVSKNVVYCIALEIASGSGFDGTHYLNVCYLSGSTHPGNHARFRFSVWGLSALPEDDIYFEVKGEEVPVVEEKPLINPPLVNPIIINPPIIRLKHKNFNPLTAY